MGKKQKRIMILSGTYIVLMLVLLIGVSTARYTDSRVAYSSFGAASFNVVILDTTAESDSSADTAGENTEDTTEETAAENTGSAYVNTGTNADGNTVGQFGKTMLGTDLEPGMGTSESGAEAKVYPFTVANGTSAENASDVAISYEVTLRTTRNLPLSYTLTFGNDSYTSSVPTLVSRAEGDTTSMDWYEWSFIETAPAEGETSAAPVFYLEGGALDTNDHSITIGWPIKDVSAGDKVGDAAVQQVDRTNSTDYMKEVELLEVLVTATSRNETTQSVQSIIIDPSSGQYYSDGYVVIGQSQGETSGLTTYPVDYRSFKTLSTAADAERDYSFTVTNGAGLKNGTGSAVPQYYDQSTYTVQLKAPCTPDTVNYEYDLSYTKEDGTEVQLTRSRLEYRLYDEYYSVDNPLNQNAGTGYGSYSIITDPAAEIPTETETDRKQTYLEAYSGSDSRYRLYVVCSFTEAEDGTEKTWQFVNRKTVNGETVYVAGKQEFTVHLSSIGETGIPESLQTGRRLQILVDARFTDTDQ